MSQPLAIEQLVRRTQSRGRGFRVWIAGGEVRAAYRPRGGPWGAPESLDTPGAPVLDEPPRVEVQPNGEFVAAWLQDRVDINVGYPIRWARRPAGGGWTGAQTIDGIGCCPALGELMATADGAVTLVALDEGGVDVRGQRVRAGRSRGEGHRPGGARQQPATRVEGKDVERRDHAAQWPGVGEAGQRIRLAGERRRRREETAEQSTRTRWAGARFGAWLLVLGEFHVLAAVQLARAAARIRAVRRLAPGPV